MQAILDKHIAEIELDPAMLRMLSVYMGQLSNTNICNVRVSNLVK